MKRFAEALALAASMLAGCSVLVPADLDEIRCSDEGAIGPPACPAAQFCMAGNCTECGLRELCFDGRDNDCNGSVDDACDPVDAGTGGVGGVGGAGGIGGVSGSAGMSGVLGGPCGPAGECGAGQFCLDPMGVYGLPGKPFCTSGCCRSSDCSSPDTVCWPTPAGAGVCRLAVEANRPRPGEKPSGDGCLAPEECRSGLCEGGYCLDMCCRDSDCTASQAPHCTLRSFPDIPNRIFACGPGGSGQYQDSCSSGSSCASNVCAPLLVVGACTQHCCSSLECGSVPFGGGPIQCVYTQSGSDIVANCQLASAGSNDVGQDCTADDQCRSAKCLQPGAGQPGYCSDVCCRDADCGDPTRFGCHPVAAGGTYVLRCVKR